MGDTNRDGQPPAKKVRVACRRCRTKRVKCDGGIPACGNCARAKAPCIDVDSRNNDQSIPRDYATKCSSRIKWLEQKIRLLDPNFNLEKGPQVEKDVSGNSHDQSPSATESVVLSHALLSNPQQASADEDLSRLVTGKRSYDDSLEEPALDQPLSVEARSVAMDLGMISLHSDSRQKHYLGTSSGLLFMKLIGAGATVQPSSPSSYGPTTASSRNITSRHRPREDAHHPLYSNLKKELPPPEDANLLLAVYFQYLHIEHPFLHPTSLINAYNALYASNECMYDPEKLEQNGWLHDIKPFPYNGKLDITDGIYHTPISISTAIFHVFMVFSLAATVLTRKRNFDHSPIRFYRMAMQSTSDCFSGVSVSALQGVLLLAVQGLIEPAGLNIWTLMHVAMSHCVDLGLHREPDDPSDLSPITRTIRRLIFHAVYSLDRSVATIQGRPLGIRDETFDVRQPTLEEIASDKSYIVSNSEIDVRPPPIEYMAFALRRFRLDRYISEIKLLFYHLPSQVNSIIWPSNFESIQKRIKNGIDQWLADSSTVVAKVDSEESLILHCENLKLESQYHFAVTLLYQPSQVFRSPTQYALSLCYQSCSKRLRIYSYLNNEEQLYYNWRNIHGIFSSGATIVYCLWVSPDLRKTVPFADALRDLLTCSNLLSIGGQWWPSVRQGKESFEKVMDLTIKELSRIENRQKPSPAPATERQDQNDQPSFDMALDEHMSQNQGSVAEPRLLSSIPGDNTVDPMISGVDMSLTSGFSQHSLLSDSQSLDDHGSLSIDPAIESFMADYLQGDWGWDPFSGTGPSMNSI